MPTKEQLYDLATAYQIEGRSTMSKAELMRAIEEAGGRIPEDDDDAATDGGAEAAGDRDSATGAATILDLYTTYTESVAATQDQYAKEHSALVDRLRGELTGLAQDATKANPLPAYLKEVSEAYRAGDTSRLGDANRKLLKHFVDMEGVVERRYTQAVRAFIDDVTKLYRRSRDECLAKASTYADQVQAEWKSMPTDTADTNSVGILQHSLLVGTAARSLDAFG